MQGRAKSAHRPARPLHLRGFLQFAFAAVDNDSRGVRC